ncbi:Panacea domain-containing protein [Oceanobacillus kimchii]|uniref:Panacea domain-containing protein n=1 Tax=Oceanobacillus kimchii TaxID=746691 RepID=UPI003C76F093
MKINEILYYFLSKYPHSDELSKTRLTKMVYLADWFSARKNGRQLTDIDWYFDHYGPYVSDVYEVAKEDENINIERSFSQFGSPKEVIRLVGEEGYFTKLNIEDVKILDEVIENTKQLYWNDFINFVYSSYPIKTNSRYSYLKLVELAEQEKNNNK